MGDAALNAPLAPPSYVIDIVKLSKRFRRQTRARGGYGTVKSAFLHLFSRRAAAPQNITPVIEDLTLRIPHGASVGIIGRNGAGKSTLLKLITGIYRPDSGSVRVRGRVAALIELGAGFHPDFTGRENLYLGGVMHGLTRKEIDERFDKIVQFAELSEVIDDPIRTYSSGMFMRLGFSLAVHTDPDILIVDEVLAVGDAAFVAKCKDKIGELKKSGTTLLLVSHDLDAVTRWCDETVWLQGGKVMDRGDPRRVIDHYREFLEKGEEKELAKREDSAFVNPTAEQSSQRWGSREIEFTKWHLQDGNGLPKHVFHRDDPIRIECHYKMHQPFPDLALSDLVFGVAIHRADGLLVYGTNTDIDAVTISNPGQEGKFIFTVNESRLLEGSYTIDLAVHAKDGYPYDYHKGALAFSIRSHSKEIGIFSPSHKWEVR
jgi:lipopolysaccharide transport system ATP-binding protein